MRSTTWLGLVLALLLTSVVTASADDGSKSDFALFDGSNPANQPDSGAVCSGLRGSTYHVAVANWGSAGEVRITYKDGDFVRFPIAAGASFAFSQAGGSGKTSPDRAVRVSNGGSAAQLAGVMSATGGEKLRCVSCDAIAEGGVGDAACDAIVPN